MMRNAISRDCMKVTGALELRSILCLHIQAKVNEHATMKIDAILEEAVGKEYMSHPLDGGELCLQCNFGEGFRPCFSGKIITTNITMENNTYFLHAECVSGSRQFDKQVRSRSFQDAKMTYKELLRSVASDTGNIVPIKAKSESIEFPIIQYEETDWEFIRRLASRFNTVIIPEITCSYPQVSFGIVNGATYDMGSPLSYDLIKDLRGFHLKSKQNSCDLSDFISYRVRDFRNYQLGDKIVFRGYKLIVMEKQADLINGLLEFTYMLGTENAFGLQPYFNEKAAGLTLEGKVLWTSGERVKVKLDIDPRQDEEKAYPFSYVPETGNIMYAMPEKGARIYIYLPASDESGAMAVGCHQPDERFPHHFTKFMLTPYKKQLFMNPGKLAFVARQKSTSSAASLSDRLGVDFKTTKSIRMYAQKAITFHAGESYFAKAGVAVKLIQSDASSIEMSGNMLDITARKILTSALTVPDYLKFKDRVRVAMPNIADAASAVLGAMSVGGAPDGSAAAALGAIPSACSPSAQFSPSAMGKMFAVH